MHSTSPSLLRRLNESIESSDAKADAWCQFVELYTPLLVYWIRRAGLDQHEAADIVQEVMLVLTKEMPNYQYDENGSFRAWLRVVTLNKCRDFLRRNKTRRDHERVKALEATRETEPLFEDREFQDAVVKRALTLIKPEFEDTTWRAFWESAVLGRRAKEIAHDLQMSVNAVYLARGRVMRRLRSQLDGMF